MKQFTLIFHTIKTNHRVYYQVNIYLQVDLLTLLNKTLISITVNLKLQVEHLYRDCNPRLESNSLTVTMEILYCWSHLKISISFRSILEALVISTLSFLNLLILAECCCKTKTLTFQLTISPISNSLQLNNNSLSTPNTSPAHLKYSS